MFKTSKIFFGLLAVILTISLLGVSAEPARAAVDDCAEYHTVVKGEYLVLIARSYDVSWRWLAEINDLAVPSRIYPGQELCVALDADAGDDDDEAPVVTIPTFSIAGVVRDETVTIQTKNFPADTPFRVRMGRFGTRGIGGVAVATLDSGDGGAFSATFDVPDSLAGLARIAIRLEATDGSGYFAYNWFYNNTASAPAPGDDDDDTPLPDTGSVTIPTFSISGVVRNSSVTIRTKNFPAGTPFKVLVGEMGTRGVGGVQVATLNSGDGGAFTQTFSIPASLQGDARIAIRLEATDGSGYFAYNWFYNNTYP